MEEKCSREEPETLLQEYRLPLSELRDGGSPIGALHHDLERAAQTGKTAPQRSEIHIRVMLQGSDGRRGEAEAL